MRRSRQLRDPANVFASRAFAQRESCEQGEPARRVPAAPGAPQPAPLGPRRPRAPQPARQGHAAPGCPPACMPRPRRPWVPPACAPRPRRPPGIPSLRAAVLGPTNSSRPAHPAAWGRGRVVGLATPLRDARRGRKPSFSTLPDPPRRPKARPLPRVRPSSLPQNFPNELSYG